MGTTNADAAKAKSLMGSYLTKKYEKVLDSLLAGTNAETKSISSSSISNRELIHGVATSLFDATCERLRASKEVDRRSIEEDFEQYMSNQETQSLDSFWKDENFRQEYENSVVSEEDEKTGNRSSIRSSVVAKESQDHFVDILLDKMISKLLPDDLPEREQFTQRVNDPYRRKRQTLSATVLGRNMRILTTKLGSVFEFQDSIIRLLTWRNPSGTVTMLIFFTFICFNPMLLLIIPLLYVLYGLMVPGYLQRHPLRRSRVLMKKTYGKSLLDSVASGGKSNTWHGNDRLREINTTTELDLDDVNKAHNIKQSMEFIINLRDLQNSMSVMVMLSDKLEKFVYGTAGFKDEHHSTALFLTGLVLLSVLWMMASFINWSLVTSLGAWTAMIAIHPKVRPKITKLIKAEQIKKGKEVLEKTERYDIILDEAPEVNYVEVFEIYKQGITPRVWDFYKISSQVFDPFDSSRKSQRPPIGVDTLEAVAPPPTWFFDQNLSWEIDYDVTKWSSERGLNLEIKDEFLLDDLFKRRRLTRKVLRYANPARKPSYR